MTRILRCALGALMIAAACGGGDTPGGGSSNPSPGDGSTIGTTDGGGVGGHTDSGSTTSGSCGDGRCSDGEHCGSCTQDCGCSADRMCLDRMGCCVRVEGGWSCEGGTSEAPCTAENSLVCSLPGRWVFEVGDDEDGFMRACPDVRNPGDGRTRTLSIDPDVPPDCGRGAGGDACIFGLCPIDAIVLDGTRLFVDLDAEDVGHYWLEGTVQDDGQRIVYDYDSPQCGDNLPCAGHHELIPECLAFPEASWCTKD